MGRQAIYKEVDPRDQLTHYIGRSADPYRRHRQHLTTRDDSNAAKQQWLDDLARVGLGPDIEIIEWCDGEEEGRKSEVYWIDEALKAGMPLTNIVSKNPKLMTDAHAFRLKGRREERLQREAAAHLFELQVFKFSWTILSRLSNYRYTVRDNLKECELTVIVLPCAFDYYEYGLNRVRPQIDLLVVQHHNAVVPLRVLDLHSATERDPSYVPTLERQPGAKRPNHDEVLLLVSKLLLGMESAKEELAHMPPRTRQRYLQRCQEYLKPRVGRPWAS